MFLKWVAFLLLVASINVQASAYKTEIIEYIDDAKVVAFVDENDISRSAQWDPMQQAVPLEISNVVDIVRQQALASSEGGKLSILEIELKEIPKHRRYWHYLVKTRLEQHDSDETGFFIVLMDGKVIPAIQEPETIK